MPTIINPFIFAAALPTLIQTKEASIENTNHNSIAATFDAMPAENSLIIVRASFIDRDNNVSMSIPTGFSQAFNLEIFVDTDLDGACACFYKVAGVSESSLVTVLMSNNARASSIEIMEWGGMATSSPLDVVATNDETSSTGLICDTGTTAATAIADSVVVAICCIGDDDFDEPESSDWINSYTQSNTFSLNGAGGSPTDYTVAMAHKILTATGTQNTTLTHAGGSGEERWSGIAVFKGI